MLVFISGSLLSFRRSSLDKELDNGCSEFIFRLEDAQVPLGNVYYYFGDIRKSGLPEPAPVGKFGCGLNFPWRSSSFVVLCRVVAGKFRSALHRAIPIFEPPSLQRDQRGILEAVRQHSYALQGRQQMNREPPRVVVTAHRAELYLDPRQVLHKDHRGQFGESFPPACAIRCRAFPPNNHRARAPVRFRLSSARRRIAVLSQSAFQY
jgi:hypothetical protein